MEFLDKKKNTVFISSTHKDLENLRKEIIFKILKSNFIPISMELACSEHVDIYSSIENMIDDSDYYILIIGDEYGTMCSDGISYTEYEYEYALKTKKNILCFIKDRVDYDDSHISSHQLVKRENLKQFKNRLKGKICKSWSDEQELIIDIITGLFRLQNEVHKHGWIPGEAILNEKQNLEKQLKELKAGLIMQTNKKQKVLFDLMSKSQGVYGLPDSIEEYYKTVKESVEDF